MGLAPVLDALDVLLVAEVTSVARFSQPAALTFGLAGAAAAQFRTVGLMIGIAVLRSEELLAAKALTTICLWTHDSHNGVTRKNLNRLCRRRDKGKKEEGLSEVSEEKPLRRKWNFKPPAMPQFHFAAHSPVV